jgi:predicted nuclease of predicted toxin-antitoxin system
MKYLLFNFDTIKTEVNDPSELTDEEFEALASQEDGFIIESDEDFESRFNSEHFSTVTHQLRIIK